MFKYIYRFFLNLFRWIRRSIILLGCCFFLAMNVLTLTSGAIQSALSSALGYLGISTVLELMESRIGASNKQLKVAKESVTRLSEKNRKLTTESAEFKKAAAARENQLKKDLDSERARTKKIALDNRSLISKNKRATATIGAQKILVKELGGRVSSRTLKAAALNVSSIPFESVPWAGAAVIIGVTAAELHMACSSIDDMDELYRSMNIQLEGDQGMAKTTCLDYKRQVEEIQNRFD